MMGDHVCGGPGAASERMQLCVLCLFALLTMFPATPPLDSAENLEKMPSKHNPTNGPSLLKPGRQMPPRVDTSAASEWAR